MSEFNQSTSGNQGPWDRPSTYEHVFLGGPRQRDPAQPPQYIRSVDENISSLLPSLSSAGRHSSGPGVSRGTILTGAYLRTSQGPTAMPDFVTSHPTAQPSHGLPSSATIGDDPAPVNATASSQRLARRPRTRQPGDALWLQNKGHIERLYMKQGLPLPEVVRIMERDYSFSASEKMYKNKFKIWHWSKNLPQDKAMWMAEKVQQRRPAKTVFYWNQQEWTEEQLAQKCGQAFQNQPANNRLTACGTTPNDIDYKTPPSSAESPQTVWAATSLSADSSIRRSEQPVKLDLDAVPANLDLSQTTLSDLRRLLDHSSRAASSGRFTEAEEGFRDAVSGFRFLLSPTHEETLKAGYLFATFYADKGSFSKADEVLNWMSEKHVHRWGTEHKQTYLHYARMVELFRSWGRRERAEILVYKLLDCTRDVAADTFFNNPQIERDAHHQRSPTIIDLEQSFPETDDPDSMNHQLYKIDLAIMTDVAGFDDILKTIIRHCKEKPNDPAMLLPACRAKCALAKLCDAAGQVEETHRLLNSAKRSLAPMLVITEEPLSRDTIDTARRLAYLFFEAKQETKCTSVLEEVIASMEARHYVPSYQRELDDIVLLDFVMETASYFHKVASWEKCRYWVERGLGLAIKLKERKSSEAMRFQKILEKQDFGIRSVSDVTDLMRSSRGFFNIKLV